FFRFPGGLMVEFNDIVRGISFPLLGNIQPSEFMKVILVLTIAHIMVRHNEKYVIRTVKSDLGLLVKIIMASSLPMSFIAIQPDLGSVLVLLAITASMILVSGI